MNLTVLLNILVLVTCATIVTVDSWDVQLNNSIVDQLQMGESIQVEFNSTAFQNNNSGNEFRKIELISTNLEVVSISPRFFDLPTPNNLTNTWSGTFNITGKFIGYTKVYFQMVKFKNSAIESIVNSSENHINVVVVRKQRLIDNVFIVSVAILMSIIFINLGCALELKQLKECIKKPIAPIITFLAQFISYYYAKLIFPNSVTMQLGLYFTGISPGGGAASVWALLLGGNINLSVLLTTLGTLQSFIMIPFWAIFLGKRIFDIEEIPVPYSRIGSSVVALIIPLLIGYSIQCFMPRVCKLMIRVLKPLSSCLILFIIIFAIATNLYLFQIFSWQIILAGAILPWTGFLIGFITAYIVGLPKADIVSMTIESGIQNTGIAIFMLKFSLGQPAADITTVVPVAVALMTPIPLTVAFLIQKCVRKKGEVGHQDVATISMLDEKENGIQTEPTLLTASDNLRKQV
ncbi:ileal sodium/bile acid cotransporter-like isoform X2 [Adelges cooleyi]|uniref:ileal sodium/bile acid cotransporter-like isoform X2 n=1 Tax=Adelges cooleyi TaxID=133065 RepID=UPI0021808171|nr:ileal sodium/bile acid cotransporter-like isoform X2 [Adelges cooleyi]